MKVIKEYKVCEKCDGIGVFTNGEQYGDNYHWWLCEICQGNGRVIKPVIRNEISFGDKGAKEVSEVWKRAGKTWKELKEKQLINSIERR